MSEDGGADVLLSFLDGLETHGVEAALRGDFVSWPNLEQALARIVARGLGTPVAEWFVAKVTSMARNTVVAQFFVDISQLSFKSAVKVARQRILVEFSFGVVRRITNLLRAPTVYEVFLANIRNDLLFPFQTNELPIFLNLHDPDPIVEQFSSPLIEALHSYALSLIQQLEESQNTINLGDEVIQWLHDLGLTRTKEIQSLLRFVATNTVTAKVREVVREVLETEYESVLEPLQTWKTNVIDTFLRLTIDQGFRFELEQASMYFSELLLLELGTHLSNEFFVIVVDFPHSLPVLHDLRYCLSDVKKVHKTLIQVAQRVLAEKLQHAGPRTEDVLVVLVGTIRALHALFPKNEIGGVVATVCGDTLLHLRTRSDSISAVVNDIMLPAGSEARILQDDPRGDVEEYETSPMRGDTGAKTSSGRVLQVLMSVLSLNSIIREYRIMLASALLKKVNYDIDTETEVLERMKSIFGEDVLSHCVVMLRDIQQSKRYNAWIANNTDTKSFVTTTIISQTCWPPTIFHGEQGKFSLHPRLCELAEGYSTAFRSMKPNQRLRLLPRHGTATLTVTQQDESGSTHLLELNLSLFTASIFLHLRDAGEGNSLSITEVANKMSVSANAILDGIRPYEGDFILREHESVKMNTMVRASGKTVFLDVKSDATSAGPDGVSNDELEVYSNMVFAMLKTGGVKTAAQIENSMRMFAKFQGTSAQARAILMHLVGENKIVTNDGGHSFTAPKK